MGLYEKAQYFNIGFYLSVYNFLIVEMWLKCWHIAAGVVSHCLRHIMHGLANGMDKVDLAACRSMLGDHNIGLWLIY
jgi:hypothetical protein